MSRKRPRIRPESESIDDGDDSASLLDHSQISSPCFTPRIENVVSIVRILIPPPSWIHFNSNLILGIPKKIPSQ
jgi:hypothetical protein